MKGSRCLCEKEMSREVQIIRKDLQEVDLGKELMPAMREAQPG